MTIIVLGDLIADFNLRIPSFPVQAGDITRADYLSLGPGGAANVAITAARLGLPVACLAEIGDDRFGRIILEGLAREGIDTSGVILTTGAETPVAGVVVDNQGEPAYLGYRGSLTLNRLHPDWAAPIELASAVFADGWADHSAVSAIILDGLKHARQAGVPTFFDPGPGNPEFDLEWHRQATAQANVLLATEAEASRITQLPDPLASAKSLLGEGPELVIIKRGVAGCLLLTPEFDRDRPRSPGRGAGCHWRRRQPGGGGDIRLSQGAAAD